MYGRPHSHSHRGGRPSARGTPHGRGHHRPQQPGHLGPHPYSARQTPRSAYAQFMAGNAPPGSYGFGGGGAHPYTTENPFAAHGPHMGDDHYPHPHDLDEALEEELYMYLAAQMLAMGMDDPGGMGGMGGMHAPDCPFSGGGLSVEELFGGSSPYFEFAGGMPHSYRTGWAGFMPGPPPMFRTPPGFPDMPPTPIVEEVDDDGPGGARAPTPEHVFGGDIRDHHNPRDRHRGRRHGNRRRRSHGHDGGHSGSRNGGFRFWPFG